MDYFQNTILSKNSILLFNRQLNLWVSFLPKSQQNIINILLFPENSVKILNESLKTKTNANLHTFYTAIISLINHTTEFTSHIPPEQLAAVKQKWCEIRKENQLPIVQRRYEELPTELQLKKGGTYLKYEDIIKKRDSLPFGSIERLLLGFYTYLYPVRADYFATEIVTFKQKPTEQNYIRRITPDVSEVILNDFKTKYTYKQIKNILPPELNADLVESLRIKPRKYLFVNQTGQPFTRNAFTIWSRRILTRLFEVDLTLTIIRHLFINTIDFKNIKLSELHKISEKMGHNVSTQREYQWNLSKDSDEEED